MASDAVIKRSQETPSELKDFQYINSLDDIDAEIEARIRRKYDKHIMPLAVLIYLASFIDRANMGNARVLGMENELGLTGNRFNITLTVFFTTYIFFELPSNLMCKICGPHIWLPFITFSFGLITMCLGLTTSYEGITIGRAFLGVAEAGIAPGTAYMLSTFYRRHELVTRVGFYASFASLAGAFGGLLSMGFNLVPAWGMMHTWRNIFFFEGIITMIISAACFFLLPASPETASFLTPEERHIGAARIRLEVLTNAQKKLRKYHFRQALCNVTTIAMGIITFCSLVCMNSIALFMPSILTAMGYSSVDAQLMSIPPYAVGTIVCIILCRLSDRLRDRGSFMAGIAGPLIVIAFIILLAVPAANVGVRYMAIFFATAGAFTASPMVLGWVVENAAGPMVRAIVSGVVVCIGCTGGLVATWTYLPSEAPEYRGGHIINLCVGSILILTSGSASLYLRWINRRRDAGKQDHVLDGLDESEIQELGHSHPSFRFTP
ncbi:major facilitator superfamily domain-containing protein [Dichotomocladium elegans]|nr:major facilitator superfamily domain-containing protein [Dichotomocladium elegans]